MYAHLYCKSGMLLKLTKFNQIIHKMNKKNQTKTEGTQIEEWHLEPYEKERFS